MHTFSVLAAEGVYNGTVAHSLNECTIIENAIDYVIQVLLGCLAFSTLLLKWRLEAKGEGDRRPTRVFLLDTTKQSAGFFVAHIGNMAVAEMLAVPGVSPCVWYFVNIVFDTTARVFMAYVLLRMMVWSIAKFKLDPRGVLDFGDYGDLYVLTCSSLKRWFMQLLLWVGIVLTTVVLKGLLVWVLEEPLASWGNFMLGPLEDHTKKHGHTLELIVVMMIIPFVLCAMQLWIQDSFLQSRKRGQGLHRFSEEDLEGGQRQYRQAAASAGPLFLLSDAFWGPDSHRYGKAPLTEQTGGTSQDGSSHAFTLQGMATISPPTHQDGDAEMES